MKTLTLAPDLKLPIDAATQTFAFIARKGAGKTYAAGKLVELFLEAGVQVVVVDMVGNWYGLRLGADGKSPGFDVPVLGGLRGDIPLEAAGGALIADIVADTGRSLILDASQFNKSDRQRFAAAFGERLWQRKKAERHPSPVMLVIEESQLIVPQDVRGDTATMVGVFEEIIRLGRNYGIGVAMITQRPQSVNKEVLNMTECLFVGQVNGAQERDALKKWIKHQGMDVNLVDELPSLPIGTFYVWSPQWLQILQKVQILPKVTYDASATPKVGDKRVQRDLKPLDLSELQERMKATIEKAKADDPRELKRQIVSKDKQIQDLQRLVDTKVMKVVPSDRPILTDADRALLRDLAEALRDHAQKAQALVTSAEGEVHRLIELAMGAYWSTVGNIEASAAYDIAKTVERVGLQKILAKLEGVSVTPGPGRVTAPARVTPTPATSQPRTLAPTNGSGGTAREEIGTSGAYRMLVALAAQHPNKCTASKLAILTGIARTGGTFRTYLGKLKTLGWVEGGSHDLGITNLGLTAVGQYEPLPTGHALRQFWQRELGNSGARNIFDTLVEVYPQTLTKDDLATRVNMAADGGTFRTYLGKLRTLELVERKALKASDVLFD